MNHETKFPIIDITKTYGFQITVFPPTKPKYTYLVQQFKATDDLELCEDEKGYHLTMSSTPLDIKIDIFPHIWDEKDKQCKITFTYCELNYKNSYRKQVIKLGREISSCMNWKHKIIWFTEEGKITETINGCRP